MSQANSIEQSDSVSPSPTTAPQERSSPAVNYQVEYTDNSEKYLPSFNPKLSWTNAQTALSFPIQWMAIANQGTLLIGSHSSKTFYIYNAKEGKLIARESLNSPISAPPTINGNAAIMCDMTNTIISFNTDAYEDNWVILPQRMPRSASKFNKRAERPIISKAQSIVNDNRIVTMTTDGLVLFFANRAPHSNSIPDFVYLLKSPDELGTFTMSPIIISNVLYACTTSGHLHYININNLQERGIVKNAVSSHLPTTAKEVRVPLIASSRNIYLATMDGTINCYTQVRKYSDKIKIPTLIWRQKLPSKHLYQSNVWGQATIQPILSQDQEYLYVSTADGVHSLNADSGEIVWSHSIPQGVAYPPSIWSRYLLLITGHQGKYKPELVAIDPTNGKTIAKYQLPGTPTSPPIVWKNNIILGYKNGYIECYDLAKNATKFKKKQNL